MLPERKRPLKRRKPAVLLPPGGRSQTATAAAGLRRMQGIARIISTFGDALRDDIFKEHVGRLSTRMIARNAKDRRPGALGYAEAMLIAYNAKNKYRLSMRKLYGKSSENDLEDETDEEEYEEVDEMGFSR